PTASAVNGRLPLAERDLRGSPRPGPLGSVGSGQEARLEQRIDLRVLGPLAADVDGAPLALGGAKQRALLALLVLSRNEVVSLDRLVDGIWGERPPATAVKMVQ